MNVTFEKVDLFPP